MELFGNFDVALAVVQKKFEKQTHRHTHHTHTHNPD